MMNISTLNINGLTAFGQVRQSVNHSKVTKIVLYNDLIAEYNSTGTLQKRYVHSNGVDEPIVVYNDTTTTNKNWFYADHLGSIVATANTAGAATANYTYTAEGKQGGSPRRAQ